MNYKPGLYLLSIAMQQITPKINSIKQQTYYLTVSVDHKFHHGFPGRFCFEVSHKAATNVSTRAAFSREGSAERGAAGKLTRAIIVKTQFLTSG